MQRFDSKQGSVLFSIVKALHLTAVSKHLTIDRAFDYFKQLLLRHSVHRYAASTHACGSKIAVGLAQNFVAVRRPPFSFGMFTLPQAQSITHWMLSTYFMHYKLYQYAFTAR